MTVKPVPEGAHTVTPHLTIKGASDAIEFYKQAFGAQEIARIHMPDGKTVAHAAIRIGDSVIFLNDEFPDFGSLSPKGFGGSAVTIHLYVPDVDNLFAQAVNAGARPTMPVEDTFWGDRYGTLEDPFGHKWSIGTRIKELSPQEIEEAARKMMAEWGK